MSAEVDHYEFSLSRFGRNLAFTIACGLTPILIEFVLERLMGFDVPIRSSPVAMFAICYAVALTGYADRSEDHRLVTAIRRLGWLRHGAVLVGFSALGLFAWPLFLDR